MTTPHYRAFVSSTYVDLKDHRSYVIRALRKAGIFVDPMEDWTADPQEPKKFSQDRVDGCDLCVLLVAFRRGFVADGETLSITQLEYQYARDNGIDVLPFLLDDDAPWPRKCDETHTDAEVEAWRDELRKSHGCGKFGLDPATIEIQPAVTRWIAARPEQKTDAAVPIESPSADSVEHYLKRLADDTKHLTLLGMGRSLQVELPIAEAYVPLRTTLARSWEEQKTLRVQDGQADYEEKVDLGEVFRKAAVLKYRGVILLGEPGSGKTTGARQLAWRLASGQSTPAELGLPEGMTPVLLRFRNLGRTALAAKKNGLREFLVAETNCDEAPDDLQAPGPDLWNRRAGGLLWLLDGLDLK